jgi:hypothetical protein
VSRVRWSLRTRLVVVFGATFVLMQLADAAYLLRASRGATRQRLESAAHQYAIIATPVVVQSFDTYFDSGYFKFRQLVIDLLARTGGRLGAPDLRRRGARLVRLAAGGLAAPDAEPPSR